ncbi:hypothetical protein M885DRAFT_565228 [Pelagophyceae sp. CCMP2097]|nr:hypothetical protein M885DRAFT_565228 [Pelagophyceae sp. CCMP2097]
MARAYMPLDAGLGDAFQAAQEDSSIRWLSCKITDERIRLAGTGLATASVSADFDALEALAGLTVQEPAFVLFARDEANAPAGARPWLLLAWVPDSAAPRLKMLYSSSREDLKAALGAGFFASSKDYCCNAPNELNWAGVVAGEARNEDDAPLTEKEVLFKEMELLEKDTGVRSAMMASMPFTMTDGLEGALLEFGDAVDVVTAVLDGESLSLFHASKVGPLSGAGSLAMQLPQDAPCFLLRSVAGEIATTVFVYYCPENASIKSKMTYSTAKATFVDLAMRFIKIDKR